MWTPISIEVHLKVVDWLWVVGETVSGEPGAKSWTGPTPFQFQAFHVVRRFSCGKNLRTCCGVEIVIPTCAFRKRKTKVFRNCFSYQESTEELSTSSIEWWEKPATNSEFDLEMSKLRSWKIHRCCLMFSENKGRTLPTFKMPLSFLITPGLLSSNLQPYMAPRHWKRRTASWCSLFFKPKVDNSYHKF